MQRRPVKGFCKAASMQTTPEYSRLNDVSEKLHTAFRNITTLKLSIGWRKSDQDRDANKVGEPAQPQSLTSAGTSTTSSQQVSEPEAMTQDRSDNYVKSLLLLLFLLLLIARLYQ